MRMRTSHKAPDSRGYTLVEILVVMVIFIIVVGITGNAFNLIAKQAAQQARTAESNIEGVVGLEMMRKDITSAGFGLPWEFQNAINYQEADAGETLASVYNDAPSGVPRAVSGGNDLTPGNQNQLLEGSDYLVIRSTPVGATQAAQRWSYMNYTGATKPPSPMTPKSWTLENLAADDLVIVVTMNFTPPVSKVLIMDNNTFYAKYPGPSDLYLAKFEPQVSKTTHYVYGVYRPNDGDVTSLGMPFNRADYYVRKPADDESVKLPARCAPNTGILFKALVSQKDGTLSGGELPLLDCVADMQVVYNLYSDSTGANTDTDVLALNAGDIRDQLKAIKVYILTHDGIRDPGFTYSNRYIAVGPSADGINTVLGRQFDLETLGDGWQNYRWKVYRMVVNLPNIGSTNQ